MYEGHRGQKSHKDKIQKLLGHQLSSKTEKNLKKGVCNKIETHLYKIHSWKISYIVEHWADAGILHIS